MQVSTDPMGHTLRAGMLDFIDRWFPVDIPVKDAVDRPKASLIHLDFRRDALRQNIVQVVGAARRSGRKGLDLHTDIQRGVAALGAALGFRGCVECGIHLPGLPKNNSPRDIHGTGSPRYRVDVAWAVRRQVMAVFEIDSTVKRHSFDKLMAAAAPLKCWVYFGPDIWAFKQFMAQHDPHGELLAIPVGRHFIPHGAREHFAQYA